MGIFTFDGLTHSHVVMLKYLVFSSKPAARVRCKSSRLSLTWTPLSCSVYCLCVVAVLVQSVNPKCCLPIL